MWAPGSTFLNGVIYNLYKMGRNTWVCNAWGYFNLIYTSRELQLIFVDLGSHLVHRNSICCLKLTDQCLFVQLPLFDPSKKNMTPQKLGHFQVFSFFLVVNIL